MSTKAGLSPAGKTGQNKKLGIENFVWRWSIDFIFKFTIHLAPSECQQSMGRIQLYVPLTLVMLSPSVATLITTTQKRLTLTLKCPPISIGNQTVNETDGHKVLGVTTDCSLSWSNYVTALCNSTCNKIDRLSKFKHVLNLHARKLFFHAHIQSIIGY